MKAQRLYTMFLIAGLSYLTGCLGPQSEEPTLRNSRQRIDDRNQGGGGNGGGGGGGNQQLNFAQANAIIKKACGGAACHGDGASGARQKYVDDQQKLTERKDIFVSRINDGTMPIAPKKFDSDADKQALIAFVQSLGNGGGGGAVNPVVTLMAKSCGNGGSCHAGKYDNEATIKQNAASLKGNTQRMLNSAAYSKNAYNDDEKKQILDYVNSL